ncbi:MAG TPA: YceH family protein [Acidimicrobiia bacterium]|nr:YceH family protein [Acidimicrobiia bacterium]
MEPLTPEELRVVSCLVEKQFTTPDSYPLTENAVVAACNQLSNRNPVVAYDTNTVRVTLTALRQRGLARVIHTPGARVPKHRQILDEALGLSRAEVSLLAVLALRGPQTVGELRTRTERMHEFTSLSEVEEVLEGLASRSEPLVTRLERQPGQKEARYAQLLAGPFDAAVASAGGGFMPATTAAAGAASPPVGVSAAAADTATGWAEEERPEQVAPAPVGAGQSEPAASPDRVAAVEKRLAAVEAELAILQAEHRELREDLGLGNRPPVTEGVPAEPD